MYRVSADKEMAEEIVFSADKKSFEDFGIIEGDTLVVFYSENLQLTAVTAQKDIRDLSKLAGIEFGKLKHLVEAANGKVFVDKPKEYKKYSAISWDQ